jgi:hypothetical protein
VESPAASATAPAHHEWNTDQLHALQDLHWLNSEGYVIEYSDGIVFIGVTEPPPPKPKPVRQAETAPATVAEPLPEPAPSMVAESVDAEPTAEKQATEEPAPEPTPIAQAAHVSVVETPEAAEDGPAAAPFSFMDEAEPAEERRPVSDHA